MNEEITVSVYCMVYNHEKYIKKALDGMVMQKTDFRYEVIVHDDASTDKTAEIIKSYAEKYPDKIVPILQTENQYSKKVRISVDVILPRIRGKYVAICEGDDYWTDEHKLQKQIDFLEKNPDYSGSIHAFSKLYMKENDRLVETRLYNDSQDVVVEDIIRGGGGSFSTNSLVYRADVMEEIPEFIRKSPVGDYALMLNVLFHGKVYYINELMSVYRYMTPGSWSDRNYNNFDAKKFEIMYHKMVDMLKAADEYSNYKYTDAFARVIDEQDFSHELFINKAWTVRKKYPKLFKKLDRLVQIKLYVKSIFPFLKKIKRR